MSFRKSCGESVVMSGRRSICSCSCPPDARVSGLGLLGFGCPAPDPRPARSRLLEVAVELLDLGLVQVNLRECVGDFVVRKYALLLTLGYETFDLFQFVQFALQQIRFDSLIPSALSGPDGVRSDQIHRSFGVAT